MKSTSRDEFDRLFPDDDTCLDHLFNTRFGKLPCCPKCGVVAAEFFRVKGRRCYACVHCRYQLYPMAGTIFHGSTTGLRKWFQALYLFSISRNGISSPELQRELDVTLKCAWRIGKKIREALKQGDEKLKGIVECDEAYIGGRRRSSNRYSNKVPLLGAVERGGRARVRVVDHASATTAMVFLFATIEKGSEVQSDESRIYNRARRLYDHHAVAHGAGEYVRGKDYTNNIEGLWGRFKPSLNGTHRSVSKKYLQLYVNEHVWKYNHRGQDLFPLMLYAVAQPV